MHLLDLLISIDVIYRYTRVLMSGLIYSLHLIRRIQFYNLHSSTMERLLCIPIFFIIVMVKCDISQNYFQTCSAYINKKSSSEFMDSHVTTSVCTCSLACSITYQCDAYTCNSRDQTCSLHMNREVEFINETTTDTQLYVERRPDGNAILNVIFICLKIVQVTGGYIVQDLFVCLTPLSATFQQYHGNHFQRRKKQEYPERTTDHGQFNW